MNEIITVMQRKQKQAGEGAEKFEEEREGEEQKVASSRSAPSEGGEGGEHMERLKWRVYQLEKDKLELTSSHNQEVRSSRTKQMLRGITSPHVHNTSSTLSLCYVSCAGCRLS